MNMNLYFARRERRKERLQKKAAKQTISEIDKLQVQAERERLKEQREQDRAVKKMDREYVAEEAKEAAEKAAAHRQELVERLGELGAVYELRAEAKRERRKRREALKSERMACIQRGDLIMAAKLDKKLHRRKRTPVEREALSRRRFQNKQVNINRCRAKRLGMTIEQYQLFIINTENRKRTAADFPDWSGI